MTATQIARNALAGLQPPPGSGADVWAARITACWRASVTAIIEVGRLLGAAKEALPHGAFGLMCEEQLPFSASTAQRLMAISADSRISNPAHVQHLPASWGTLYELTKLSDEQFDRCVFDRIIRPDMLRRDVVALLAPPPPSAPSAPPENRAPPPELPPPEVGSAPARPASDLVPLEKPTQSPHNANRVEDADSLDYSPTPPWATRALFEHALPRLGVREIASAWDPACGEGHMTAVMEEYVAGPVIGTDIHDYSREGVSAPAWLRQQDFLDGEAETPVVDWIVTNPPFGDRVLPFMERALGLAQVGVAMFLQLRYLEGSDRYERVFRNRPPTMVAPFVERVPLLMGRYEADASTMTAFMWLVWIKDRLPVPPFWIPPRRRVALRRDGDDARFEAHPVAPSAARLLPRLVPPHDPETGELIENSELRTPPDENPADMERASEGGAATGRLPVAPPSTECTEAATSGKPSPGTGPQAEAPHAGIGSGTPAGHAADSEGRGANAPATISEAIGSAEVVVDGVPIGIRGKTGHPDPVGELIPLPEERRAFEDDSPSVEPIPDWLRRGNPACPVKGEGDG